MRKFTYLAPKTMDEAISLHQSYGDRAKYIAGGTDVLVKIKEGKLAPDYLISLKNIIDQKRPYLNHETGELFIGAFLTHRAIEKSSVVQLNYPILHDAVRNIGSVQIRNVATIGGNLVNAVPSADGAIPLIALDGKAHIYGTKGHRSVDLRRFFMGPGQCDLERGEILLEIVIPPLRPTKRWGLHQAWSTGGHGTSHAGCRSLAEFGRRHDHLCQGPYLSWRRCSHAPEMSGSGKISRWQDNR